MSFLLMTDVLLSSSRPSHYPHERTPVSTYLRTPKIRYNPASPNFRQDTEAMEAFAPPSASPSHYSPEAIGFLIGAGAFVLILIAIWVYIAAKGGPSEMLRSFRARREAKRKARDIEMAERAANTDRALAQEKVDKEHEEEQKAARREALNLLNGLMANNNLVGSTLPARPKAVNFQEEQEAENRRLVRFNKLEHR